MNEEEHIPSPEASGNLRPPRPPKPPVVGGMAEPEGDDGSITISLPPKGKETVRIAVKRDADFEQ